MRLNSSPCSKSGPKGTKSIRELVCIHRLTCVYYTNKAITHCSKRDWDVTLVENLDHVTQRSSLLSRISNIRFNPKVLFKQVLAFHIIVYVGLGIYILFSLKYLAANNSRGHDRNIKSREK